MERINSSRLVSTSSLFQAIPWGAVTHASRLFDRLGNPVRWSREISDMATLVRDSEGRSALQWNYGCIHRCYTAARNSFGPR